MNSKKGDRVEVGEAFRTFWERHGKKNEAQQSADPVLPQQSQHEFILDRQESHMTNVTGEYGGSVSTVLIAQSSPLQKEATAGSKKKGKDGKKPPVKGSGEHKPVEWSGASALQGMNLEIWWLKSSMLTRLNVMLVVLCLTFGILYLTAGIWYISKHLGQTIKSPYVCQTKECHEASQWLTSTMNLSVSPCDHFYEFMCGNYHHEEENTKEGRLLNELIATPVFKVEFGANSILAKMLQNFQHDAVHDQSIRFYQACLNEPIRKKFGLEALVDTVEKIFGTRDFSNFESSSLSMEQIGANMLTYTGDATYINMAFYTYPYIVMLRPSQKMRKNRKYSLNTVNKNTELLFERIFQKLMPLLGVHDAKQIKDAYRGVDLLSTIVHHVETNYTFYKTPKRLPVSPEMLATFEADMNKYGLCPPMGIQLNIRKLLALFIQDEFRLDFYDMMAFKFFAWFQICFSQDPSKFTYFKVDYPKLAFVAPWLFGIFWDFLPSMNTKDIMAEWRILSDDLPDNDMIKVRVSDVEQHIELRCMLDLGRNMGYIPVMHYLTSTVQDPLEDLEAKKAEIRQLYAETGEWYRNIPSSEIDPNGQVLGEQIFGRAIHVDVIMPLISGVLDRRPGMDRLNFSQDHLRNSFTAIKFAVASARHNWLGSTNTEPTLKWWGSGNAGREDAQTQLFDIRRAFIRSAEFDESVTEPANHGSWQKFLGRPHPQPNYLLYFLTIFDEPYTDVTLSLKTSGISLKILRSIYPLLSDAFMERYSSFWFSSSEYVLVNKGDSSENRNRSCAAVITTWYANYSAKLEYTLNQTLTTGEFTWGYHQFFYSVLTLKQSFQLLHKKRKSLSDEPFSWNMEETRRKHALQRLLPGKLLEKYSEEQLFFMAFVRNACRGSWRTHHDELREERFFLEKWVMLLLMQTEEFSKVWKCKEEAFMSNKGYLRCTQWIP